MNKARCMLNIVPLPGGCCIDLEYIIAFAVLTTGLRLEGPSLGLSNHSAKMAAGKQGQHLSSFS